MIKFLFFFVAFNLCCMENVPNLNLNYDLLDAVEKDDAVLVEELIRLGANPNADCGFRLPLSIAARHGNIPMCRLLLRLGADVNAMHKTTQSAIHAAAFWCQHEVVAYLHSHDADLNLEEEGSRFSPLHSAVLCGWNCKSKGYEEERRQIFKTVGMLLLCGADRAKKNISGETPAETARVSELFDVEGLLQAEDPLSYPGVREVQNELGRLKRHFRNVDLQKLAAERRLARAFANS